MRIYDQSLKLVNNKARLAVVIGNFDGVHLAHQAMFKLAQRVALPLRLKTLVYSFNPHPTKLLSPQSAPSMIMSPDQKIAAIKNCKIDILLLEKFNNDFAKLGAREWFETVIIKRLRAKAVIVGYDFTFGKARSGNVSLLQELCAQHQIKCEILKPFYLKNTLISSSRIRQLISSGDVAKASQLLGRNYFMDGTIIKGLGRGKKMGIPTANLDSANELIPAVGVYASRLIVGKQQFAAITNVGFNPTFGNKNLSIESYLFDYKGTLYNKKVRLEFISRIREERKFPDVNKLIGQIKKDFAKAKLIHTKLSRTKLP